LLKKRKPKATVTKDDNILGFQIIPEYLPENKLISYKKLITRIIAIRKTSKD
tara:strand:- start:1303 stop:1458 length:156 start_codon:yes stop_codon:yes gene_type:complete